MPVESRRWGPQILSPEDQHQIKRAALIREAGKAFSKNGYHNTSLDEVAKTLKVSKTALYHYVKDKNEILYECHVIALDFGDMAMAKALSLHKTPFERLRELAFQYLKLVTSEFGSYAVLIEPVTSLRPRERELILERRRRFDAKLKELVRQGIQERQLAPSNPAVMVSFMMGAINFVPTWFRADGKVSGEDLARQLADLISLGLRGNTENIDI